MDIGLHAPGGAASLKRELRRKARALRAEHLHDAPASFLPALLRLPAWTAARTVALYIPQPGAGEPPTADLFADCWNARRRTCVPTWVPEAQAGCECQWPTPGTYAPALVAPGVEMVDGPMGIPEPVDPTWIEPKEIDLFVLPGLLFDRAGRRLGHGKGFLDRFLAARRPGAAVVGLAWPWQIVDSPLPDEPHDVAMDALCFPDAEPPPAADA